MNRQRIFNRGNIYSLKRDYGLLVYLHHILSISENEQTGESTVNKIRYTIKKAILLPKELFRTVNDKSNASILPSETDVTIQELIIDHKDILIGYEFVASDYFVINNQRYNIISFENIEEELVSVFKIKHMKNSQRNMTFPLDISDELELEETLNII